MKRKRKSWGGLGSYIPESKCRVGRCDFVSGRSFGTSADVKYLHPTEDTGSFGRVGDPYSLSSRAL